MLVSKDHGIPAALATLVSFFSVLSVVWFVVQPLVKSSISTAMADEIQGTVQRELTKQLSPVKSGFDVLLSQQILQTQKDIALLERKGATNLTPEETTRLVELRSQLEAQQRALAELRR